MKNNFSTILFTDQCCSSVYALKGWRQCGYSWKIRFEANVVWCLVLKLQVVKWRAYSLSWILLRWPLKYTVIYTVVMVWEEVDPFQKLSVYTAQHFWRRMNIRNKMHSNEYIECNEQSTTNINLGSFILLNSPVNNWTAFIQSG